MADNPSDKDPRVVLDFARASRTGLDEAILADGKSIDELQTIIDMAQSKDVSLLFTRLSKAQFGALCRSYRAALDYDLVSGTAILSKRSEINAQPSVCIVSAGASDARVAAEAARTLEYYGEASQRISDVGVAGLWRLTERLNDIGRYPVVIVVAGMDAAMVTVLAGLISSAIIAVPTSTGYGVADHGRTALNAILTSCGPGITAVNIDNGYGAACAAMRTLRAIRQSSAGHAQAET